MLWCFNWPSTQNNRFFAMLMLSYWKQKHFSRFWRLKPPGPRENYFSLYFKFNYEHRSSGCEPLLEICLEIELLQALDRALRSTLFLFAVMAPKALLRNFKGERKTGWFCQKTTVFHVRNTCSWRYQGPKRFVDSCYALILQLFNMQALISRFNCLFNISAVHYSWSIQKVVQSDMNNIEIQ